LTAVWVFVVITLASILYAFDNLRQARRFSTDFAMMVGCTAVVIVPIRLS